mgnify:CR=1
MQNIITIKNILKMESRGFFLTLLKNLIFHKFKINIYSDSEKLYEK